MSEAAPAPNIRYETNAEPPLRLEKPLPETPTSNEPLPAMEEWFPAYSCQAIQLSIKKTCAAAIPATSICKIGSQPFVKPEVPLPERSALESFENLALALGSWPTPTSKPATLSESPRPMDDLEGPKESDSHGSMARSQISLAEASTRTEIRNFSRPLGTPQAPLEISQPSASIVPLPPRLIGSSRYSQGGFASPTAGDIPTTTYQLSSMSGGRLEGEQKNKILWQREDDDLGGKDRSCSLCRLM